MTKMFSKVLLAAGTMAVMLSSCSKVPEQSKYIPKTAGVVLSINSKQISNKLVTNGITMDKMFAAVQDKDTSNPAMKAWKDAENSGVDLQNNFFVSVVFNNSQQTYVTLTGGLKDASKFEEYLKKNVANFTLKKKNDFQYIWEADQQAVIGWNKETVIYVRGLDADKLKKGAMGMPGGFPSPDDDSDGVLIDSAIASPARMVTAGDIGGEDVWVAETAHLFHLKKDEYVNDVPAFKDLLKNNADLSVYVNPEPIYSAQATMIPANVKELIAGSYYTGAVNFEKGKIVMDGHSYVGKKLAEIYKKYGKTGADVSMLTQYPSKDIDGYMVYGFDFRVLGDLVKAAGMDGMANMALRSSNLTLDDVLNAFKGEMVVVSSDFSMKKVPSKYFEGDSLTQTDMKWLFAMKVGDKAAFEKVMSSPMLQGLFHKEGDKYVMQEGMPGMPAISITDKLVVSASDKALLDAYLSGKGKAEGLDDSFVGKIKGNTLGGYLNFEKIADHMPDDFSSDMKPFAGQVKNLLKDMTVLAHEFDGSSQKVELVLNFRKEDENSLVQLVNLGTSIAKTIQQENPSANAPVVDTVAAPGH